MIEEEQKESGLIPAIKKTAKDYLLGLVFFIMLVAFAFLLIKGGII